MRLEHQKICELLRKEKKGYLLDAACGKGELGSALEDMGFEAFSMDRYDSPANKKNSQRQISTIFCLLERK